MTAAKAKPAGELRMSAEEFDRIMGKALQVKPEGTPKTKRSRKRSEDEEQRLRSNGPGPKSKALEKLKRAAAAKKRSAK